MIILSGKMNSRYEKDGIQYGEFSFFFDINGILIVKEYEIPVNNDVKIGDTVTLTVTTKPAPHPLRRFTDGPAIEGTDIAVITKIEPKE